MYGINLISGGAQRHVRTHLGKEIRHRNRPELPPNYRSSCIQQCRTPAATLVSRSPKDVGGGLRRIRILRPRRGAGLPIGLIAGTDYSQTVVTLDPSDLLVLYTDGVTEAENDAGQSPERETLLKWVLQSTVNSPEALGRALLPRLESFQGRSRNDDETLVVLQREGTSLVSVLGRVATSNILRLVRRKRRQL